ncbi:hypothetical protein [Fructilactobacillus florum]|uniref:hypothetical protein n=2 Tax=Fructilactobacillus florum TaxID=640331 RepID=UPI00028E6095|nr:hypothetical protein [Fructilactobacillus florum]EKK21182.1 DNA-directed RNA polymerase beta subunit [Fructilactobacillus florum 2F]
MNNYQFNQEIVDRFFKYDYHDRGMVKWQGFYLSDHTTAMNKQKVKLNRIAKLKEQQTLLTIKNILFYSLENKVNVIMQLNEVDVELNPLEIVSQVAKLNDIKVKLTDNQVILLESIRNVFTA